MKTQAELLYTHSLSDAIRIMVGKRVEFFDVANKLAAYDRSNQPSLTIYAGLGQTISVGGGGTGQISAASMPGSWNAAKISPDQIDWSKAKTVGGGGGGSSGEIHIICSGEIKMSLPEPNKATAGQVISLFNKGTKDVVEMVSDGKDWHLL